MNCLEHQTLGYNCVIYVEEEAEPRVAGLDELKG